MASRKPRVTEKRSGSAPIPTHDDDIALSGQSNPWTGQKRASHGTIAASIRTKNQAARAAKPPAGPKGPWKIGQGLINTAIAMADPGNMPPVDGSTNGGGGGGGGGGGYAMPVFDTSPFDAMRARLNAQTDASKRVIGQSQAELIGRLNEHAAQYKQAADKLTADLAAQQQQAQQAGSAQAAAVQGDLAQQGVNTQAIASQAQAQEQARAQAQARQQDYLARLSQMSAQNTADRQANANTMFANLTSQAEMQRNQQLNALDAKQAEALASFASAMRGGGGRGGGGGGGRSRSSGGSDDMSDGALIKAFNDFNNLERVMNPASDLQAWAPGFAGTLWGAKQQPALDYFSQMVGALEQGNVNKFEQMRRDINKANLGRDAAYNRQVLQQGAAEALANMRRGQQRTQQFGAFARRYGG